MKEVVKKWLERYLSDPEAVLLVVILLLAMLLISTTGTVLAPVFAGLVIAYLLEGLVVCLEHCRIWRWIAVTLVYILFMGGLIIITFIVFPLFLSQLSSFVSEFPQMVAKAQGILLQLPENYPEFVSEEQVTAFLSNLRHSSGKFGQTVLSFSLASIPGLITVVIYLVLVPFVVFFFMLDRDKIMTWVGKFLPTKRTVMNKIWAQVNMQWGNYVRGKVVEILIVACASYAAFFFLNLQYAFYYQF